VTRLEAYRAALSAANRDGDIAVVKALTAAVAQEVRQKASPIWGRFAFNDKGKSQTKPG
jgi:hypothetical protein